MLPSEASGVARILEKEIEVLALVSEIPGIEEEVGFNSVLEAVYSEKKKDLRSLSYK